MKALQFLAAFLSAIAILKAGVVQGSVVEHASGRPMARTVVRLIPVPSAGGTNKPLLIRAGISGHFVFPVVADGLYLLTATRPHYFPASYGARLPHGQGTPITVTRDSDLFAELRMRRMGAITGRILDENGIGISDAAVVAYRARLPLRIAGTAMSDDRGVYRVHGLDPGRYWIRTSAVTLDDGSTFVPTFSPESIESREGRLYQVTIDAEATDADVRIIPGRLLTLTTVLQCPLGTPARITLSSETGSRSASVACGDNYRFEGLAPGPYEIFGQTQDGLLSGFVEMALDHDLMSTVIMSQPSRLYFEFTGGASKENGRGVTFTVRRQDLGETGQERELKLNNETLTPGHWEIGATAPAGQYIESITNSFGSPRRQLRLERPVDRFDIVIESRIQARIRVVISDQAGAVTGTVLAEGKTAAGVPVFLWPIAADGRRSLRGAPQTITDTNGAFRFAGLPPGDYRILATFDYTEIDDERMEFARAATIHVDAQQTTNSVLTPWLAPY